MGREVNAITGVAACSVGTITSLLLLVIVHTNKRTHRTMDRTTNLLISSDVHYVHLAEITREVAIAKLQKPKRADTRYRQRIRVI